MNIRPFKGCPSFMIIFTLCLWRLCGNSNVNDICQLAYNDIDNCPFRRSSSKSKGLRMRRCVWCSGHTIKYKPRKKPSKNEIYWDTVCFGLMFIVWLFYVYCMFVIVKYCICYMSLVLFCIADGNLDIMLYHYVYLEQWNMIYKNNIVAVTGSTPNRALKILKIQCRKYKNML